MAKKIQYSDRKKLIEARNFGSTDAELKQLLKIRDNRTLTRHLKLGELEEEARSVKVAIIKDALTGHFNEIRELIEQLQKTVRLPLIYEVSAITVSQRDDFEHNDLFKAIKKHIPSATLWRKYATWNDKLREFVHGYEQLVKEMEIEGSKWGKIRIVTKTFSTPILKRLHDKLIGRDDQKHMFDKSTDRESKQKIIVRQFEVLSVDGFDVLQADDTLAYRDRYQELSDRTIASTEAGKLVNQYKDLQEAGVIIDEYIRIILLRRDYIMYNCKLCPGQTGLRLSKNMNLATRKKLSKTAKEKNS